MDIEEAYPSYRIQDLNGSWYGYNQEPISYITGLDLFKKSDNYRDTYTIMGLLCNNELTVLVRDSRFSEIFQAQFTSRLLIITSQFSPFEMISSASDFSLALSQKFNHVLYCKDRVVSNSEISSTLHATLNSIFVDNV